MFVISRGHKYEMHISSYGQMEIEINFFYFLSSGIELGKFH